MGPVLIGARARIASQAVIVGPTVIGEDAIVGPRATVSRSVLHSGAHVADAAHVDWCVVTAGADVRAGSSVEDQVVAPRRSRSSRVTPQAVSSVPVTPQNAVGR
jgi:NDP-sugar pyrophosphorylase family protein